MTRRLARDTGPGSRRCALARASAPAAFALSLGAAALPFTGCVLDWPPPVEVTDGGPGDAGPDASVTGHLYVIGGIDANDEQPLEVLAAPVFADGSWGEWTVATTLPEGRDYHASTATPKHLYVLGGETFTFTSDALVSEIESSGTLSSWATTTDFATERFRHSAVTNGTRVYVIGGLTFETTALSDVQSALINSDGSLGGWAATTPLPAPRHRHASSTYSGFVYVLGGSAEGTVGYLNDVWVAPSAGGGELGAWTETASFVTTRHAHRSVAANGRVYVLGGVSGAGALLDDVQLATMNIEDGTLASWTATTSFDGARQSFGCTIFNNRIYVIGGRGIVGGRSTVLTDGQFATIQDDGTVGPWTRGIDLPVGRVFHTLEGG